MVITYLHKTCIWLFNNIEIFNILVLLYHTRYSLVLHLLYLWGSSLRTKKVLSVTSGYIWAAFFAYLFWSVMDIRMLNKKNIRSFPCCVLSPTPLLSRTQPFPNSPLWLLPSTFRGYRILHRLNGHESNVVLPVLSCVGLPLLSCTNFWFELLYGQ